MHPVSEILKLYIYDVRAWHQQVPGGRNPITKKPIDWLRMHHIETHCDTRSNMFRRRLNNLTQSNSYYFQLPFASDEEIFEFMPALTKAVFTYWCEEQYRELNRCIGWDNSTVKNLAQTMVNSQNYDDTPILADALEEVGYQNQAILFHLRDKKHCSLNGLQFHPSCGLVMNIARYVDLWNTLRISR